MADKSGKSKLQMVGTLLALYARMDFRWFTQDTAVCLIVVLSEMTGTLASISGIFLLSARFGGVGGLTEMEILFLLGFFTLADGLTYMLFGNFNVLHISRRVGRGQVDHMLIQPVPLWMQLLTEGFMPVSGNSTFLAGLILMIIAVARLPLAVTPGWLMLLLLLLVLRMAVALGVSYLCGSLAFYQPVACEEFSSVALDTLNLLGKYPLSGLPAVLVGLLVTALPSGLLGWLPALILLGKAPGGALLLPVCVAAGFTTLATYCFRKGLRHYAVTSCNRYKGMGHRS